MQGEKYDPNDYYSPAQYDKAGNQVPRPLAAFPPVYLTCLSDAAPLWLPLMHNPLTQDMRAHPQIAGGPVLKLSSAWYRSTCKKNLTVSMHVHVHVGA